MKSMFLRMAVVGLALIVAGSAMAQEGKKKRERGPAARANGSVVAVSADSMTLKTKDGEEVFALNDRTQFTHVVPGSVDDLSDGVWAMVSGDMNEGGGAMEAKQITVMPKPAKGDGGARGNRATGTLTASGDGFTLQAGEQQIAVTCGENVRVMLTQEATAGDVETGARVTVMGMEQDGAKVARSVRIMPQREGKKAKDRPAPGGGEKQAQDDNQ